MLHGNAPDNKAFYLKLYFLRNDENYYPEAAVKKPRSLKI